MIVRRGRSPRARRVPDGRVTGGQSWWIAVRRERHLTWATRSPRRGHDLCKQGVRGSSPPSSTRQNTTIAQVAPPAAWSGGSTLASRRATRHLPTGIVLAGALLAPLCLAACSSGDAINTGPFGGAGTPGLQCSWAHRGGVLTDDPAVLRNRSLAPAHIEKVALIAPRGLQLVAAYAVPITGTTLYGMRFGFPTGANLPPGVQWSRRQRANGATISHSVAHHVTDLVLVLKPAAAYGSALGVDVYYKVSGQQYQLRTDLQLLVFNGRGCPANFARFIRPTPT